LLLRSTAAPLATLAYAALLAWLPVLQPARVGLALGHVFQLQSKAGALSLGKALLLWALLKLLGCVPLGALSVLCFPDREDARERRIRVVLPAAALALTLAYAVCALQLGSASPSVFALALAFSGAGVGVWIALSARRGPRARRLIVPKLAAASALLAGTLGVLAWLAIEPQPALAERPLPGSDMHRELVGLLHGNDPRKIPEGETRSLRLNDRQVDAALAWGFSLLRARSKAALSDGGGALQVALPILGGRRWLNIAAAAKLAWTDDTLEMEDAELRVGRVWVPPFLVELTAKSTLAALRTDPDADAVLGAVRALSLRRDAATLTYAALRAPSGLAARLLLGDEAQAELRLATRQHVDELLARLAPLPPGDERFRAALSTAFGAARARATDAAKAPAENRAALIALGIVLGHPKLARALGERFDYALIERMVALREGASWRGRNDWVRHFTVSAALTVLSDVAPSDAAGLLKEELDADHGSGFSFADLLADRSGTMLALRATESEAGARRVQEQLGGAFTLETLLPDPSDLPEGIPDAELKARYGGVGGPGFNTLSSEIERRVAACPLLGS
jgi:hypothetical protein